MKENDSKIKYGELEIEYDDIYINYEEFSLGLGLYIYINKSKKYEITNLDPYKFLNKLLGEYDTEKHIEFIRFINWGILSEEFKKSLLPFKELKNIIQLRK